MKSVLLLGGFLVSTALAAAGTLAQPASDNGRENRPVRTLVYDVFGRLIPQQPEAAAELADRLVIITRDDGTCQWCNRLKPTIRQLKRQGYAVEVVAEADYKAPEGEPPLTGMPTLQFWKGEKKIYQSNYLSKADILKRLGKPAKKPAAKPTLPPQPGDEPAPKPPAPPEAKDQRFEPQYDLGWAPTNTSWIRL